MQTNKINGVDFSTLFQPGQIICRTESADRDAVLHEMLHLLYQQNKIADIDNTLRLLLELEDQTPAIVCSGLAVPHLRLELLNTIAIAIATSPDGIAYAADSVPVKLLILILAPKAAPGSYLQALSSLTKICQNPEVVEKIARLPTRGDIWEFFHRHGMVLPDYLSARHIMEPVGVKLHEHDTLEDAIDLFVRHNIEELPVVDNDGDLIGVVSAHELLRVCLPDYILWMEDLSSVLNFEPFAELLRKESKTWLAEIMTNDYATVSEDAPAVQVAREMARLVTNHGYVLKDKKLVGVVALEKFLKKILRE